MSQITRSPSTSTSSASMPSTTSIVNTDERSSNKSETATDTIFSTIFSSSSSSSTALAESNLGIFYDEWSRCVGSSYQVDHLYRLGRFDSCGKQWGDLKTVIKVKFTRDPKNAQELLNSTYYKKRTTISPTAGAIWELKSRPGWD